MSTASPGKRKPLFNKDTQSPFQKLTQRTINTGEQSLKEAREIEIGRIATNPNQPRRHYNETTLAELAEDIKIRGILQPVIVRPWQGEEAEEYQLVVGERRYRAAKIAGLERVPALVRDLADDEVQIISLVENIQREDLDIGDEAAYFKTLQEQYGQSIREIAAMVNKSKSYVEMRLKLAANPALIQEVRTGKIGLHNAVLAARLGIGSDEATLNSVREKDNLLQAAQSVREKDSLPSVRYPLVQPFRRLTDLIKNSSRKVTQASPAEKAAVLDSLNELEEVIAQLREHLE